MPVVPATPIRAGTIRCSTGTRGRLLPQTRRPSPTLRLSPMRKRFGHHRIRQHREHNPGGECLDPCPFHSEYLYEREALRREILAAIAAGRELAPELDSHLADAALDRYAQEAAGRGYRLWRAEGQPIG